MNPYAFKRSKYQAHYNITHVEGDQIAIDILTRFEVKNITDEPQEYYTKLEVDAADRADEMEMTIVMGSVTGVKKGPFEPSPTRPEVWEFRSEVVEVPPDTVFSVNSSYRLIKPRPELGKPHCEQPSFGAPLHGVEIRWHVPDDLVFIVDPVVEPDERSDNHVYFDADYVPNQHIPIRICVK